MTETTLFTIACEMLRTTNPFKKDMTEICFTLGEERKSLLKLVSDKLSSYRGGTRNHSKQNLLIAYHAIKNAMIEYLEDFHSSFSFKQKTKATFANWLKSIQINYDLGAIELPVELEVKHSEFDTAITMLKELHSRDGVTKD